MNLQRVGSLKVAVLYALFGVAWILLTDWLAAAFVSNPSFFWAAESFKGIAYVLVTALLVFFLVRRESSRMESNLDWYHTLFSKNPDALLILDADGTLLEANDGAFERYGFPREEFIGLNIRRLLINEDLPSLDERLTRALQGELRFDIRHKTRGGRLLDVEVNTRPLNWGGRRCILESVRDITDLKNSERERLRSRGFQQALMDCSPVAIISVDLANRVTFWNEASHRIFGWTEEEILGKPLPIIPEDLRGEFEKLRKQVLAEKNLSRLELVRMRKDGSLVDISLSTAVLFDSDRRPAGIMAVAEDITRRKKGEAALRESEEKFRRVIEEAPFPIILHAEDGEVLLVNRTWLDLTGYTLEEVSTIDDWTRRAYGDRAPLVKEYILKTYEFVEAKREGEFEIFCRDGSRRVWDFSSVALGPTHSGIRTALSIAVDVTDRVLAEKEHAKLRLAIDNLDDAVVITDASGTIQFVNPAFERVTGYDRTEVIGQKPNILKSGKQDEAFYRRMWETISSGEPWYDRFVNKRKDGTLYVEQSSISSIRDSEGNIVNYVAVKRDITSKLDLEEQLRQSQKMDAIGQLAGGVAHDFNNILQAIFGYSHILIETASERGEKTEELNEVFKAAQRAADLTRQLLAFSRRQVMQPKVTDLNAIVENMLKMLRRVITENIRLEWIPGNRPGRIYADEGMMEQVLMNLCVNARDAMGSGGVLTIGTDNVEFDEAAVAFAPWTKPGKFSMLTVRDTGCGMDRETVGRIFEPFFSTKEKGKGTGLGLSTVYGIVNQHEGVIHVASQPGEGTTFRIYLPLANGEAVRDEEKLEPPVVGGTETVLIAEDDVMVREVAVRILREAGYTVLSAPDGAEAVKRFEAEADRIELLFFDVVMPNMDGYEAFKRIKTLKPDIPALFSSGYSEDVIHTNFVLNEDVCLIQKPYSPDNLLRMVRRILDGQIAMD